MKRIIKIIHWIKNFLKFALLKKRFIFFNPFFIKKHFIFDRLSQSLTAIHIRDKVDIGTNYQVFMDEQFSLDFLDSGFVEHPRNHELFSFYKRILSNDKKPLIIDCGSNNGSSALYFSLVYPGSKILGYEISKNNFEISKQNIKNIKADIDFHNLGISSSNGFGQIRIDNSNNNSFELIRSNEGDIELITINEILLQYPIDEGNIPFMIKIDIEGSESELFEKNLERIDKFPIIIIELHDWCMPGSLTSQNFLKAISDKDRDFVYRGENIFSLSNRLN